MDIDLCFGRSISVSFLELLQEDVKIPVDFLDVFCVQFCEGRQNCLIDGLAKWLAIFLHIQTPMVEMPETSSRC
jgi:hypothetical protein